MEKLINDAQRLHEIPEKAALAYDYRKGILTERVNQALMARGDLTRLIGSTDSLEMMQDNHRNHSMFLTAVLHLSAFKLLASVVPWVYRTYRNHGFSFDYFPVALCAWKDAIKAELNPEDAVSIFPVYDWMLQQHENVVKLVSELSNRAADENFPHSAMEFFKALMRQDLQSALSQGENETAGESVPEKFYQNTIQPAMYEVGAKWEQGEISVAEEHLATALTQTVVASLQGRNQTLAKSRGRAIIASITGELHDLGARMVSHCFEADGWDVTFLGANLPLLDLRNISKKNKPAFIGLSLAMPYYLHYVRKIVDTFKSDPELQEIPIMVGGLVFKLFPEATGYLPGVFVCNDINAALIKARGWAIG